ncbi:MAG: glycosyltransferase family 4 protein [Candidatus Gracilibacteria bacterium]|nr:glycosyltransferase family 4 protein [Candidatus Gracilibacteria bacterium]
MKTRTLFLDQGETLGGAERFLLDFLHQLSPTERRSIGPVVIGAYSTEYRSALPADFETVPFVFPQVRGNFFQKIKIIFRLFRAAYELRKLAHTLNATQIFANTPRTMFVLWIAKKFLFLRARTMVMIHDFTVPQFLLRNIGRSVDTVVVNSVPTRQVVRGILPSRHHKKIRIVENGVDLDAVPDPIVPQKIEKILLLGRIDPRKGQRFALEAADLLAERNPELQFFIVGSPFVLDPRTIEYEKEIRTFAVERELPNVHFLPEVTDPFETILQHDVVLVLPTEPETFGRVVTEALACGKFVLAFDQMGPREILRNFEEFCGNPSPSLRVEPDNAMSLAEKIAHFADHPEDAAPYTQKAHQFVVEKYPLSETRKRLLNILWGH